MRPIHSDTYQYNSKQFLPFVRWKRFVLLNTQCQNKPFRHLLCDTNPSFFSSLLNYWLLSANWRMTNVPKWSWIQSMAALSLKIVHPIRTSINLPDSLSIRFDSIRFDSFPFHSILPLSVPFYFINFQFVSVSLLVFHSLTATFSVVNEVTF